CHQSRKVPWTF
nr:immunoglobulin light chain junction region [Mus musculus]NSL99329.1 immunoglobulin light chain junction region [Mus musculus]NSL99514.1 immunoglobulin light chain junction region [Mus musculus]NSM00547.1 immunoglobulin light chain junction region [Mus musculus]NSM02197.1 immunoglobulin light chain junction region [Mus musculus]